MTEENQAREFIDRQIYLNKDMLKALRAFNESQEVQRATNREIAAHIDAQAAQIKNMRSIITAMNIISLVEMAIIITVAVIAL